MHTSKLHYLFGIAILCLSVIPLQSNAAPQDQQKVTEPDKERLVLMPLRVDEEDKNLLGAMETALVEGLKLKYVVFSGEQVSQKAHQIFMKESHAALDAHKECDATRCMQNIAEAFQAELIATANVTKQGGGYFLALSIQNIFDNKVEFSKTMTCEGCNAFKVVDKLKILSAVVASNANDTTNEETQADRKLKAEQLKKEQQEFEEKLRNADVAERKRLLDAKALDDKHLAELKAVAEARRKINQVQPTSFPALELAKSEIGSLTEKIATIEAGYEKELTDTRKQVKQRYSDKLDALSNEQKDEFESASEFKAKQEKRSNAIISQRDTELARLNISTVAETETAPLKARIKALSDHEYIIGTEGIDAELGSYDTDDHQFTIKLRSKTSALRLKLNGIIPLQGEEAKAFKKQWQTGLVRPEAKAKFNGELVELVLVNDADSTRWVELQTKFYSPAALKALFQTGRVFKDCANCPDMVVVPTGSFNMGEANSAHRVTIKQPFAMGKTEVTRGEWKAIMGTHNQTSSINDLNGVDDDRPVAQVSWNDAKDFIQELNSKTGKQYRLPSEAEWEYACQAGGQQEYCVDSISNAWHDRNIAKKQANAWGLYDMTDKLWEWVEDSYHADSNGAPSDGTAWQGDNAWRVLRGGGSRRNPQDKRAALPQTIRSPFGAYFGFRLARSLP